MSKPITHDDRLVKDRRKDIPKAPFYITTQLRENLGHKIFVFLFVIRTPKELTAVLENIDARDNLKYTTVHTSKPRIYDHWFVQRFTPEDAEWWYNAGSKGRK